MLWCSQNGFDPLHNLVPSSQIYPGSARHTRRIHGSPPGVASRSIAINSVSARKVHTHTYPTVLRPAIFLLPDAEFRWTRFVLETKAEKWRDAGYRKDRPAHHTTDATTANRSEPYTGTLHMNNSGSPSTFTLP